MELDFQKIFKIMNNALKLNRTHPYLKRDKKWLLQCASLQSYLTFIFIIVVYNIIYFDIKNKDWSIALKNGVLAMVFVVVTFQYCVLIYHRETLIVLISDVNKDYALTKDMSVKEREIVESYVNQGLYVEKQWLFLSISGTFCFFLKSLALMFYSYIIHDFRLIQIYYLEYPGKFNDIKDDPYVFVILFSLLTFYASFASVMYAAYVPLGPIFMLHACGQLDIVKSRIENLFVEVDNNIIRQKLKDIVERLQYIYRFVGDIERVFIIAYELTLKSTTLVLPVTFYEVVEATKRGEFSLEFSTFIVGSVLISSSPCYYSDLLLEKGEDVRQALYSCGWEMHYDHTTRTTLQILLLYALHPIAIRTVFRTLCLEALTDVFQQSYTIFNLLHAMWD